MALYKPIGVVSTTKYLPGRRIITEFFKGIKERLFMQEGLTQSPEE